MAQVAGTPPISPDGRFWWDGQAWQPLFSPDGRFKWNGQQWLPAEPMAVAAPAAGPAAEPVAAFGAAAAAAAPVPSAPAAPSNRPDWLDSGVLVPPGPRTVADARAVEVQEPLKAAPAPAPKFDIFAILSDGRVGGLLIVVLALAAFGGYKLYQNVSTVTPVLAASDGQIVFTAGVVEKYALHEDVHGQLTCSCGKTVDAFLSVDANVSQTVNSVDKDGTASVTMKFDTLSGQFDGQPVYFDVSKAKPITLVIRKDGAIVTGGDSGTAGGNASDSVPGGDQYSAILPKHDVKQGDSWGEEFDRPNPVGTGKMHYTTNNTFLRYDTLDGKQMAVVQTAYFMPIDMVLDIRALQALVGDDPNKFPAGSTVTDKGNEKGDMTSYIDMQTHEVALAQDVSDFDFTETFQGLPNTPQFAAYQGSFHFAGRQNSSLRRLSSTAQGSA